MKTKNLANLTVLIVIALFLGACSELEDRGPLKEELLIYCGITMIKPMRKVANAVEEQENCTIRITKGGSGNLLRSLKENKIGDLYLPGSEFYMQTCLDEGIVTETIFVGYNKAALIVSKGNPKGFSNDPAQLTNTDYAVVIANPESGSIGREAKKVLERRGVADAALANSAYFTTDSKDITKAIKYGEADLSINWYATSFWPENRDEVESIAIDEQFAPRKQLLLGLLKFSKHPDIARSIMEYVASPAGRQIFAEYGFLSDTALPPVHTE